MQGAARVRRGADVLGVDIAPNLIDIAQRRLDPALAGQVRFHAGDMTDPALGAFDHVVAMDSLIYYSAADIGTILDRMAPRVAGKTVFTVAPRTPLLMAMWNMGKLFPRADRSPVMIPHDPARLAPHCPGTLGRAGRVTSGFYISECLEHRA